jgi:hypothetical protein
MPALKSNLSLAAKAAVGRRSDFHAKICKMAHFL